MKKSMFIAAMAAIVLAGCTKDESFVEQQEIGFQPLAYKASQTKANVITGATYGTDAPSFGLFAYQLADDLNFTDDIDKAKLYIDEKEVSYSTTDGNWRTNPKSFWPLQGSLTFIAYSPYSEKGKVTHAIIDVVDANQSPIKASVLTIDGFQAGTEGQKDLMWSKLSKDKTSNGKINDVIQGEIKQEYNGVPILFNHALCRIKITAKTAEDYSGFATYNLKQIQVVGLQDNATLTVTDDAPVWSDPTKNLGTAITVDNATKYAFNFFAPASETEYIELNSMNSELVNYDNEEKDAQGAFREIGLLAIPQSLNGVQLLVTYTMTVDPDGTGSAPAVVTEITKPVTLYVEDVFETLEQNKVYTLNLSISADEILYSPDVNDWDVSYNHDQDGATPDVNYGGDYVVPQQ